MHLEWTEWTSLIIEGDTLMGVEVFMGTHWKKSIKIHLSVGILLMKGRRKAEFSINRVRGFPNANKGMRKHNVRSLNIPLKRFKVLNK